MDVSYPAETEVPRGEVRAWAEDHLAALDGVADLAAAWQRILYDSGWACPTWPREYGGRGLGVAEAAVAAEEFAAAGAPLPRATGGELLVGPTILEWGTDAQRARYLPPIARGEETWCQGFSEPGAGSDLAAVASRAVLDGDEWILHGHKIWTSEAESADLMFLLAVTSPDEPRPHDRLTYFLLPMDGPGIDVRPIAQPDGRAGFTEVLLDGARCPRDNIVGEVGNGWRVAMGTLGLERGVSASASHHRFAAELAEIETRARETDALADPLIADRLVRAWSDIQVLRLHGYRLLTAALHPDADPHVSGVAATYKFFYTEFHQRLRELALDVLGPDGQLLTGTMADPPAPGVGMGERPALHDYPVSPWQAMYLFSLAGTIYGGTSQIQRTIVAERVLGLPRARR